MKFAKEDITVNQITRQDLNNLEELFEKEFGEEINMDIVKARIRKLRQFYYILKLLRYVSPLVRELWRIFIIKVKGSFAGFIQLSYRGKDKLHLDYIAIAKEYRGQGIGRYVLQRLLRDFADNEGLMLILEVRLDNPAYLLYHELGFVAKIQIINYERKFFEYDSKLSNSSIVLELLKENDRLTVYDLYRSNVPDNLANIVLESWEVFRLNMFQRNVLKLKSLLFKNKMTEYVVKVNHKIIASINIRSYEKAGYHALTIYMHPMYELLRKQVLNSVIVILAKQYHQGVIGTSIYDDLISKQHDLNDTGFIKQEAYFFMYRKPKATTISRRFLFKKACFQTKHSINLRTFKKIIKKCGK